MQKEELTGKINAGIKTGITNIKNADKTTLWTVIALLFAALIFEKSSKPDNENFDIGKNLSELQRQISELKTLAGRYEIRPGDIIESGGHIGPKHNFIKRYEPHHPKADKEGYIYLPTSITLPERVYP